MAEIFENLDNILCDWVKDEVQKSLAEAVNRYEKKKEKAVSFLEIDQEKILEHLSRQSSKTKPNTKFVLKLLQGKKPLLCLQLNKPNEQNVYEINLFKKLNFLV